jgi:putative oxidoreductase
VIQGFVKKIPDFCLSHWLIRIPLVIVFLQQGLAKWPIDAETAAAWELTLLVWTFVVLGELGAGLGLLLGGMLLFFKREWVREVADLTTRLSGITIASIMTGVIWLSQPDSFVNVILYDNFHVMLWVGGMFFALRGNRA